MRSFTKGLLVTAALATALGVASGASAETKWQKNHPRRTEVNHRLANQNARIHADRKDGAITGAQAKDLHQEDAGIRAQERYDASKDGGHITKSEQHQLNQEENGVSAQIPH
jgi:hypothetical protein